MLQWCVFSLPSGMHAVVRGLMVLQGVTIVWVSVAEHGPRKAVEFIDWWWPCLPCVGRSW